MTKSSDQISQARRKLKKILRTAERRGCPLTDLICLSGAEKIYQKLSKSRAGSIEKLRTLISIVTFGIFACALINLQNLSLSVPWFKWNGKSAQDDLCIVPMPDELVKAFRPPVSCSICQGVNEVAKVSNLSREIFEERYAYTGKPVVIIDGMINWTAQHVFSFEFFKEIYSSRMEKWLENNCQFFPYSTEFKNLHEVFNMSKDRAELAKDTRPWYVGWSNCDDEINQILRRHYQKPYFLPETAETKKLDWIFMGSTGHGAPVHVDNVEYPSWQAQLRGKKEWSLYPPPECYYDCVEIQIVVEPGEIIVLDTNRWYHSTLIVSDEISVTIGAEYD